VAERNEDEETVVTKQKEIVQLILQTILSRIHAAALVYAAKWCGAQAYLTPDRVSFDELLGEATRRLADPTRPERRCRLDPSKSYSRKPPRRNETRKSVIHSGRARRIFTRDRIRAGRYRSLQIRMIRQISLFDCDMESPPTHYRCKRVEHFPYDIADYYRRD
jgi:hypothetical protein